MVSKNNRVKHEQWNAMRRPHYGLRKLSVGVASVLLGTTLYWGGTTALADSEGHVTSPNAKTEETDQNVAGQQIQQSNVKLSGDQGKHDDHVTTKAGSQNQAVTPANEATNGITGVSRNDNTKQATTSTEQKSQNSNIGLKVKKDAQPITANEAGESKATSNDSLATGMSASQLHKTINDKSNYLTYSDVAKHTLCVVKRTVTMHKPTGDETITQDGSIRSSDGSSTDMGWPITYGENLTIFTSVNNNGKRSSKVVYSYRLSAKSSDGGQTTVFASKADKEAYDKFMSFDENPDIKVTLPAIDQSQFNVSGYTYTISPTNSNLGDWTFNPLNTDSVNIEVNYTKNAEHTVTYEFVDSTGNQVGSSVPVSGAAGTSQKVSLNVPAGYHLVSSSLPTSVIIPEKDETLTIPVKKQVVKLGINIFGNGSVSYGDDGWQQVVGQTNVNDYFNYTVSFTENGNPSEELSVQLNSSKDLEYVTAPGNVGTYEIALTATGLQDIENQIKENYGDDYSYPDLKDVTSTATLTVEKGTKEIDLNGVDSKTFDNTSTLPDQNSFYSSLGLGNDGDMPGQISIYQPNGKLKTIQLSPDDVEFWLNGKKVDKAEAKNVGLYDLRLTDEFINKVKAADGNNGNNYSWTYGTHTPSGDDTYTATYTINQATGKASLGGSNSKVYDGIAVTTTEVNKDGKISINLTLPVYDEEGKLTTTVDLGKYTLQDGDYTWANGSAPTKGGSYTININKDKILAHLQDRLKTLAGTGTDPNSEDPENPAPLANVTVSTGDLSGTAKYDIKTTVTYQFVDQDDNNASVGDPVTITGLNGKSQNVQLTVPANYELVSDLPTTVTFGETNQTINLYVKHKISTTTTPVTVTRQITITKPGQQPEDHSQSVTFQKRETKDLVTGKVTMTYDKESQTLASVDVPKVPGYTPSQSSIDKLTVGPNDHPKSVNVTYTPNAQKTIVTYIDENGHEITNPDGSPITGSHYEVTGVTDQKNVATKIKDNVPVNWHITDTNVPEVITFTANGYPAINVYVAHNTKTVDHHNVPDGYQESDFTKTVKRTITAKEPTKDVDLSQSIDLTRTGTFDEVTKKVISFGEWSTARLDKVQAPTVAGYTPSMEEVPAVNVNANYQDPKIVITYTADPQSTSIIYKDGNTTVKTDPLKGVTDQTVDVLINVPAGYKIVDPTKVPSKYTFKASGNDSIIVPLEHQTTIVQPTDPKTPSDPLPDNPGKNYPSGVAKDDLNKTITRQITVIKPDGSRESHDQTITLTRTATVDEVTGKVSYGEWTTGQFAEYDAPAIPGYTATGNEPAVEVTSDSEFSPVIISYIRNAQPGVKQNVIGTGTKDSTRVGANGQLPASIAENTKQKLPQIGDQKNDQIATAGLLIAGLTSLFGLTGLQKKEN